MGFTSDVDFNYVTIVYNVDGTHWGYDPVYGDYVYGWTLDTLIPLPSTLLLLGSGLAGLGLLRLRRRFKA